jgi:predicted DNA-binding ribbon-helix-helix protein
MKKRSLTIGGHRTSVALEAEFWAALEKLAAREGLSLAAFIERIDRTRAGTNLSSAIRVFVLEQALRGESEKPARD